MEKETSVQVAVRIRPQNAREQVDLCRICTFVTPGEPQVILGKDKAFTYDHVYDKGSEQQEIYNGCIERLVEGCFNGFNATVLAYGQTGSGKTYTMGTGFDVTILPEEQGMIPRAVRHLFTGITKRIEEAKTGGIPPPNFTVTAQFLELYNEEIIDLFDSSRDNSKRLKIHENSSGNIYVDGAVSQHVQSEMETMEALKRGAVSRTVGSTNMNAQSSRSHAIFTILVKQEKPVISNDEGSVSSDFEMLTAKFHFVDLAGSERLKRTGATGDRAKEGISINCGLLALGNVISALGDQVKKGSHVPYRDSKLTRLLQDSLGGNSRTLMIACISPSDRDFMETLNTLKYANRARNIKNKVSVNQDKASAQLNALRKRIVELESELSEFKSGRVVMADDGSVVLNDLANENAMLKAENDKLRNRIKSMQGLIDFQKEKLSSLQADCDIRNIEQHDESTGQVINVNSEDTRVKELLQQYLHQIEDLRAQLVLYESGNKENARPFTGSSQRTLVSTTTTFHSHPSATAAGAPVKMETDQVLKVAKKDIDRLQNEYSQKRLQRSARSRRSRRRRRQVFLLPTSDRRSTDVEDWVMKCVNSESDVMITEGSDTEINEDDTILDDDCVVVNDVDSSDDSCSTVSSDSSHLDDDDDEEDEEEDEVKEDMGEDGDNNDDDKISIATSIAELSTEINIKQQLVEQLEKAQKSLNQLRSQYEDKMMLLQSQIKATEVERDQCIRDITDRRTEHEEAVIKEVKEKYEKQLRSMKAELKQLETARKEHAKALQKNAQQFTELQKVKSDLSDMKRQKIKLLRQLKEETSVMKKKEQKREKELALLKREHKRKESVIKTLQADAKRKEIIIRKRNEEVTALRRMQQAANQAPQSKGAALPASTRKSKSSSVSLSKEDEPVAKKAKLRKRPHSAFISDSAKKKWKAMEKKMEDIVSRTQMINNFEIDMEHWVKKRNEFSQKALELQQQKEDLLQATEDNEYLKNLDEELEGVCAQIAWANECIENLQDDVVNYEDVRTETSTGDAIALIHTCSTREAKFLLEKIVNVFIELSINYHQKVGEVKSLNARLQTSEQHAELIKIYSSPLAPQSPLVLNSRTVSKIATTSLQHHVLQPLPKINLQQADCDVKESGNSETNCVNTSDGSSIELSPSISRKPIKFERKLRRRTGLPNELAYHRRQLSDPPPMDVNHPISLDFPVDPSDNDDGASTRRRRHSEDQIGCSPRRQLSYKKNRSVSQISESLEVPVAMDCPGSPSSSGNKSLRHGDSMSSLKTQENNEIVKGRIEAERLVPTKLSKPLHCTHIAKGHTAGILSMSVTDTMLLSASQDCTVKVWDLSHGQELSVLNRHHSYVRKVVYDPLSGLVFTACQGLIKLWDLRDLRNAQFIKTLSPSIQQGPSHLNSADTVVQDLLVSNDVLFSASGNVVNVWDLRQMSTIGRLVGHTGTVGTMTNITGGFIATGSRDRLIKLYDVSDIANSDVGFNQISQVTLGPAHYDTVSSLSAHNDIMFSACGVSIKQWDIPKRCLVQTVDGAHPQAKNNVITSLIPFPPSLLVSACKSGILKLWRLNNDCQAFGEVCAHKSSINCISANATTLFTGSSDKTIKLWRLNTSSLSVP